MIEKTVIILRGASGSGKSTLADTISRLGNGIVGVCTADDYFINEQGEYKFDYSKLNDAHRECENKFRNFIQRETPVIIVANTNTRKKDFSFYQEMALQNGYRVARLVLEHWHKTPDVHGVPEETKETQRQRLLESLEI